MMWALVVFAMCGNPGGYFSCPARIAEYPKMTECQNELQTFGSQMINGKSWHASHLYEIWCEPIQEKKK